MGIRNLLGRTKEAKPLAPTQERTAQRIADSILRLQRSTALKLNAQAQKMGHVKTRIILGALLIGFAVYLVCILINAIF